MNPGPVRGDGRRYFIAQSGLAPLKVYGEQSYSAIWGHIMLFVLQCTCLHMFSSKTCFLHVQMRHTLSHIRTGQFVYGVAMAGQRLVMSIYRDKYYRETSLVWCLRCMVFA